MLGEVVLIGELKGEVPSGAAIETKKLLEDGEEVIQVLMRPTTEEARHPVFALFPPDTEFTLTRPDSSAPDTR